MRLLCSRPRLPPTRRREPKKGRVILEPFLSSSRAPGSGPLHHPRIRLRPSLADRLWRSAALRQDRAGLNRIALHMPSHIFTRLGLWGRVNMSQSGFGSIGRKYHAPQRTAPKVYLSTLPAGRTDRVKKPSQVQWLQAELRPSVH